MNLQKLSEIQSGLDFHIEKEKGLQDKDLIEEKILSLRIELGELANELPEEFKFWSSKKNDYGKALQEYVDCLHFILSIGLDFDFINSDFNDDVSATKGINEVKSYKPDYTITQHFNTVFDDVYIFRRYFELGDYYSLVSEFLILGDLLNFDHEEIEQAYLDKNKVNHERQINGY